MKKSWTWKYYQEKLTEWRPVNGMPLTNTFHWSNPCLIMNSLWLDLKTWCEYKVGTPWDREGCALGRGFWGLLFPFSSEFGHKAQKAGCMLFALVNPPAPPPLPKFSAAKVRQLPLGSPKIEPTIPPRCSVAPRICCYVSMETVQCDAGSPWLSGNGQGPL